MKIMLHHLTGSLQGRTQYFDADNLTIGTGKGCGVVFDPRKDANVMPVHAELCLHNHAPLVRDRSGRNALSVNGHRFVETSLNSGDLIQLGDGGPQLRFRVLPDGIPDTKSWRELMQDSRDIVVRTPHARYMSPFVLARHLIADTLRYGSPVIKVGASVAVVAPLLIIAMLGIALYHQYAAKRASERQVVELIGRLETGQLTKAQLESRIEEERRVAGELRRERDALVAQLTAPLKPREAARMPEQELQQLRRQLGELRAGQEFAEDIVSRFEGSIGLLQGGYGFKDKDTGRPLRYRGFDRDGNPLADKDGNALVTIEGSEEPVVIYYAGTAFLVDKNGLVVTNRHMARMWETFPPAQEAIRAGFEPEFRVFRLFFPGRAEPYNLQVVQLSQEVDLAILRTDPIPTGVTPLTLLPTKESVKTGEPVVVLSYPGSFDSILGRLATPVGEEIVQEAGTDATKLAGALARRKLVRPLATQGHIANVATDVITFEAGSASGSSGSPIFDRAGRVIGVNRGTLRRTGGLNVGIPIHFVRPLLEKARS